MLIITGYGIPDNRISLFGGGQGVLLPRKKCVPGYLHRLFILIRVI
jgi:hypothetical protein